jgi:hypothetical protein
VVWELEPGTVVHDVTVLPSPEHGFDEPSEFAAFLHAVRWGAIASADTTALQAVALPPGAALGDTVEPQPARATQRPDRPARPARARVQVRHFVPAGWQSASDSFSTGSLEDELDFLRIAVEKVDRIREDLGSAGEVISAQVEQDVGSPGRMAHRRLRNRPAGRSGQVEGRA